MDTFSDLDGLLDVEPNDGGFDEQQFDIGNDERRMHVRAYNHWVSLLHGRPYPLIADLDPDKISDFGGNSVLLDFSGGIDDPSVAFLGKELRTECGLDQSIARISQVPGRSLLSRLTDHYLQIIANRAPIGFEAEFVSTRGHNTVYRGILMPFASAGDTIDYIYGVINWKERVDAETQANLDAELDAAIRSAPKTVAAPIWADGPQVEKPVATISIAADPNLLADRLMLARETAAAARASETRSRAALYRALGRAHDFALAAGADPVGYEGLLQTAGITVQQRAPLTPVVKLVFGSEYDKTRLTEFATVLAHARRASIMAGELPAVLEATRGGIKALVAAERAARRSPPKTPPLPRALAKLPALATLTMETDAPRSAVFVLLARAAPGRTIEVISVIDEPSLTRRAARATIDPTR